MLFRAHTVFATACAFMLGATRTAAASSAPRIGPSAACHPSVASPQIVLATCCAAMVGATRLIVKRSCRTPRSSRPGPCAEPWRVFASRLQAVAALTALNSPCAASTIARMPSASRAAIICLFSWICFPDGRPPLPFPESLPVGWRYALPISPCAGASRAFRCGGRSCLGSSRPV